MFLKWLGERRSAKPGADEAKETGEVESATCWDVYRYGMKHFDHLAAERGYYPNSANVWYESMKEVVHQQLLVAASRYRPEAGTVKNWAINTVALALAREISRGRLYGFAGRYARTGNLTRVELEDVVGTLLASDDDLETLEVVAAVVAYVEETFDERKSTFFKWHFLDGLSCRKIAERAERKVTKQAVQQTLAIMVAKVRQKFSYMEGCL